MSGDVCLFGLFASGKENNTFVADKSYSQVYTTIETYMKSFGCGSEWDLMVLCLLM